MAVHFDQSRCGDVIHPNFGFSYRRGGQLGSNERRSTIPRRAVLKLAAKGEHLEINDVAGLRAKDMRIKVSKFSSQARAPLTLR